MMNEKTYGLTYPFSVEYIDEFGVLNLESWNLRTLQEEAKNPFIRIIRVDLGYNYITAVLGYDLENDDETAKLFYN